MKIFDIHAHAAFGSAYDKKESIKQIGIGHSWKDFQKELDENNVVGACIISGRFETETPMEMEQLQSYAKKDRRLFPVCGINPYNITSKKFNLLKKNLLERKIFGMKIFLLCCINS